MTRAIHKLMCANRGEIAIRVFRAATELGLRTVAIYSHQDRVALHRYKADESYLVGRGKSAVGAYLAIDEIIAIALDAGVDAIHPGYGFLAESAELSLACARAGIAFVGPPPDVLRKLGDKTRARAIAMEAGIPVVPGTDGPVETIEQARAFAEAAGFPVIIKAAMGGGGRGMRVVREGDALAEAFDRARSEAESSFGDGTVFVERFVERPRHIEVQILADSNGDVMHLYERDCSVQRRHQKVVEIAPAQNLDPGLRERLCADAVILAKQVGYRNAGTVEFLVERSGRHYFIESNPRIQVEHTVTEEITLVDLVQSQIRIAGGATLADLGLSQDSITVRGVAIQCRVTTENPREGFQPGTGRIEVFRSGAGMGIRLDGGAGYPGAVITPDYDSLLVKVTGRAATFREAAQKLHRTLAEFRIRGVPTNIQFLQNVLTHRRFLDGDADTALLDDSPELFKVVRRRNRAQRLLRFFADLAVNGPSVPGMQPGVRPSAVEPIVPPHVRGSAPPGWRQQLLSGGPAELAKAVRRHKALLLTDTTWRDAHQSLLMTRLRTFDLLRIAPATAELMPSLFSLEMWGGATFDVALRFLREDPWDRLERLRELVPNIPFQMLLRGANAVGYTNYPDNVVMRFARMAREHGIDIFRVFDALNYVENMKLGIDAVGQADGVIEAAICYTGDVADSSRRKYSLDYYVDRAGELVELGIHILAIKDMAGLLKPPAARLLIRTLRRAHPELPIHVHTHDTAGTGVASMLACAEEDADIVDVAVPAMAGLTSQPTIAAVAAALVGTPQAVEVTVEAMQELNAYWEVARGLYAPFETGLTGYAPDLYKHEIPGGQYTNLRFQAQALGLADRWESIKRAYAAANRLLGDVIKVTPTSKTVGDLAQFMVQNDLDEQQVIERAETLSFPQSVVDFMAGKLGEPYGGYPEPLRTRVLRKEIPLEGRPGASLPSCDFDALRAELQAGHYAAVIRDVEVMSAALYPKVFDEYRSFREKYSDVGVVPTRYFLAAPAVGEEFTVEIERGKTLVIKLTAVGSLEADGQRAVFFELNGQPRRVRVRDRSATTTIVERERAEPNDPRSVGAPMPGTVIEIRVAEGQEVKVGDPLVVLSAMKMEMAVAAPTAGKVARVAVALEDQLAPGDLIVELG